MGALLQVPTLVLLLLIPVPPGSPLDFRRMTASEGPLVEDDFTVGQLHSQRQNVCQQVPHRMLRQVLGSAYNEWYMSFGKPDGSWLDSLTDKAPKRNGHYNDGTVVNRPAFSEDTAIVLDEKPAWQIDYSEDQSHISSQQSLSSAPHVRKREVRTERHKRNAPVPDNVLDAIAQSGITNFKWHCDAPYKWKDLGGDYFPRYILSRDCNHDSCQGQRFRCEPLSIPIKVLRKRDGVCAPGFSVHKDILQIGSDQMPHSLMELWVWEMRAVSECCVCQYKW